MPRYVTGEGEPYRPEMLVWFIPNGPVLGYEVGRPGELLHRAVDTFRATTLAPMHGAPHTPARVRVASQALAKVLRASLSPGVEITVTPTPELDALVDTMFDDMDDADALVPGYLAPGIDAASVAAFFRATAGLYRAAPWKAVASDEDLISLTIESLNVRDAVLSIIGQAGQSLGVVMFSSLDDFEQFLDAAEALEHGEPPDMVARLSLNFERGARLHPAQRKEAAAHGWEVANASAFPSLVAIDEDNVARPPTAAELVLFEAIALALPKLLRDTPLARAFAGGQSVSHSVRVVTHAGELEVTMRALCGQVTDRGSLPQDPLAALAQLERAEDGVDDDLRMEIDDELMQRFVASPEASSLDDASTARFTLDYAASHLGATLASLRAPQLREIIFEIIPRKMMIEPSEARDIIEANRAFFTFLGRELGFSQAQACLGVLGGDAVRKLEAALSDPRNFGMAKSMMMEGRARGFDIDTQAGIEAWMRELDRKPLPLALPQLSAAPHSPRATGEARAKKNRRKAERKARKKNR